METSFRERVRRLLEGVIFCGVLTLIALTAVPYGTVDPWWESIFEATAFILGILWILEGTLGGSGLVREHRLLLPLLALVVFALIQSLPLSKSPGGPALAGAFVNRAVSVDPFETWRFALKLSAITLTLGLLLRYVSSVTRLQILIYLVIGIALASALFGLLRAGLPQSVWNPTWSRLTSDQSYGQFENRNHFAFLMEMAVGLVLGLVVSERALRKRLALYALSALALWAALLLTHSRGGVLSLMLELPFFFFLNGKLRTAPGSPKNNPTPERKRSFSLAKKVALATFVLAGVAASVVLIGGDETITRLESTPDEFAARSVGPPKIHRPQIWRGTLELIKDHPLVGVGFAGYSVAIHRYLGSSGEWAPQQAHNDYLEVLASGGVVGGALFAWFLLTFARTTVNRLRSDSNGARAVKCGAVAGLFAVAVHSLFDFGLHITVNSLVCTALVVVAVKSGKIEGAQCGQVRLQSS
jgi:O-antigen ligase